MTRQPRFLPNRTRSVVALLVATLCLGATPAAALAGGGKSTTTTTTTTTKTDAPFKTAGRKNG
jgi:hypothetical protein